MKKISYGAFICTIAILFVGIAVAGTLADNVFDYGATTLSASKTASFNAETILPAASIKVTRVQLFKKIGNVWMYIRDLPIPSDEAANTSFFSANYNYSDYIGTGQYRLYVTFTADGHDMSRYSNTATY